MDEAGHKIEQDIIFLAIMHKDIPAIVEETGQPSEYVCQVLAENKRLIDVFQRRLAGQTLREIGAAHGVSVECARQTLISPKYSNLAEKVENHKKTTQRQLREETILEYYKLRRELLRKPRQHEFSNLTKAKKAWGGDTRNLYRFMENAHSAYLFKHTREELRMLLSNAYRETGRTPTLDILLGYEVLSYEVRQHFGSFGNFLIDAGLLPNRGATKEEARRNLILDYYYVKERMGGAHPTRTDMEKLGHYNMNTLLLYWDSFDAFAAEAKKRPPKKITPPSKQKAPRIKTVKMDDTVSPQFRFVMEYFALRQKLLRLPLIEEFSKPSDLLKLWGTYGALIAYAEGPEGAAEALKPHTTQEISRLFSQAYLLCKGRVFPQDLEALGVSLTEIEERWGSWDKFYEEHIPTRERFSSEESFRSAVISEYQAVKKKLGKEPTLDELSRHGKYPRGAYLTIWRKYSNFLWVVEGENAIGVPPEGKESRRRLAHSYAALVTQLGRVPHHEELKQAGLATSNHIVTYGSIEEFWRYLTDQGLVDKTVLARSINAKKHNYRYTDDELIRHFYALWEKIGKQPSAQDISRFSPPALGTYMKRWGSWKNFLATQGLHPPVGATAKSYYSAEELVQHFMGGLG